MEKIQAWEKTFSGGDLVEILETSNNYIQFCIQNKHLKGEFEKSLTSLKEDELSDEILLKREKLNVINYFLNRPLPLLARNILRSKVVNPEQHAASMEFLQNILLLISEFIDYDQIILLKLFTEIFNEDAKFYKSKNRLSGEYSRNYYHHGDASFSPSNDSPIEEEDIGPFASPPRILCKPQQLVTFINYFGEECNGFENILERISKDNDNIKKITVEHTLFYLKAIDEVRQFFKSEFIKKYSLELKDVVFDLILNFSDDELKVTPKIALVNTAELINSILTVSLPPEEVGEITERFQLSVSLKCLQSPAFEKRLQGLQVINSLIRTIKRKEDSNIRMRQYPNYFVHNNNNNNMNTSTTKWLTSDILLKWLNDNEIINEFFGEKLHHEILKRSKDIFKFLVMKKSLTTEHIDYLWNSCLGKEEQVIEAVFLIISKLVKESSFTVEYINELMKRIIKFPIKNYDTNFIGLLVNLSNCCLNRDIDTFEGYPIELLWKTIQDDSGVDEEVFSEALDGFLKTVKRTKKILFFLKLCINNLKTHYSVPQSLKIFKQLLNILPNRVIHSQSSGSVESIILQIEEKYQLIDILFKDFVNYHKTTKEKLNEKNNTKIFINENNEIIIGYFTHVERIKIYLKFLEYIMKNCRELNLPKENFSLLWECIIENPLTKEEKIIGYNWISKFFDKIRIIDNNIELIEYVFQDKLCNLDASLINNSEYLCFEKLFLKTNIIEGKLQKSMHYNKPFQVSDLNLLGMDTLWKIILFSENESVSESAITFLSSIYEYLSPTLKSQQDQLRENLILKIMKEVSVGSSLQISAGLQKAKFIIERCLTLLQKFIELFDESSMINNKKSSNYNHPNEAPFPIILISESKKRKFQVVVKRSNTLLELCEKLVETLNDNGKDIHIHQVELYYCGALLQSENYQYKTLRELNVHTNTKFLYKIDKTKKQIKKNTNSLSISPRYFLSNNSECFEQLFELLDFNESVGEKVWNLISDLPVNPDRYKKILSISNDDNNNINWDDILPTHSTFQLIYTLQIIKSIITKNNDNDNENDNNDNNEQTKWCNNFTKNKGFDKLLNIFISYQDKINGSTKEKCLEIILQIINIFMINDYNNNILLLNNNESKLTKEFNRNSINNYSKLSIKNQYLFDNFNYNIIISQLLNVIWDSSKISKNSNHSSNIVKHASSLLLAILFNNPKLTTNLYEFKNLKEFIHCVILEADIVIRDIMTKTIAQLCLVLSEENYIKENISLDPRKYLFPIIFEFLSNISSSNSQDCYEYFNLLKLLISSLLLLIKNNSNLNSKQIDDDNNNNNDIINIINFDINLFVKKLLTLIYEHNIIEITDSSNISSNDNLNDNSKENNNNNIIENEDIEDKSDNIIYDLVIIGLMELLSIIIEFDESIKNNDYFNNYNIVEYIFNDCLFNIGKTENINKLPPPICKTKKSRKAAFNLLKLIISNNEKYIYNLLNLINLTHINNDIKYNEWNYSPGAEQRSTVGYIGIKNHGCICYMISLFQQLFMMPKFRNGILSLNELVDTKENPLEENIIYQIQLMFSNMQESYRQYYDPIGFCKANKDYDGQPTDVSLQMDVDEFFNMLCEKVEEGLKKTKYEKLLKEIWCGKLCSQLICQECKTNSEREEAFYTVSLDLKNKQSIKEALEFYVQGEMLTGGNAYFCEKCDKKVDALMRRCLKTLPSTLILHMKRFEFNFDTMRKLKLNDYCEFPMNLNMKPYTTEGIQEKEEQEEQKNSNSNNNNENKSNNEDDKPKYIIQNDDYYNYELCGILVHRGIADSGHYYSFIKLRNSNGEPQWIDFNDELVRSFDVNSIEKECFGGVEQLGEGHFSRQINRTRNAYMLIYERKDAYDRNNENILNNEINNTKNESLIISKKVEEDFSVLMQKQLYDDVWADNIKFMMDKKLFDKDYSLFCSDIVSLISINQCDEYKYLSDNDNDNDNNDNYHYIKTLILYFVNILIHSKELKTIEVYADNLIKNIFSRSVPVCLWFLDICTKQTLKSWLLECTQNEPRSAIINLIIFSLKKILPFEIQEFKEDNEDETKSICKIVVDNMLFLLKFTPWYWRNFYQFFTFFEKFAMTGYIARDYLEGESFLLHVGRLISIGRVDITLNTPKMGDKFEQPNFSSALSTLSILIRGSYGLEEEDEEDEIIDDSPNPYAFPGENIDIMESEIQFLFSDSFLKRVSNDGRNTRPLSEIICFLSWNSPSQTEFFERYIRSGINDAEYDQLKIWFEILQPVIGINDALKNHRVEYYLTNILHIIDKFKKYPKFTKEIIIGLFSLYEYNEDCREWLEQHRTRWSWIEKYINSRGIRVIGLNAGKSITEKTAFKRVSPQQQTFQDQP